MLQLHQLKKISSLLSIESRFFPLLSVLAGALTVFSFAPFNQPWLIYPLVAFLFYVWSHSSPKKTLLHGWLFGFGMQSAGVSWLYFSLHYHGGSPAVFAVLLVFLLASCLSIYTALAGYIVNRFCKASNPVRLIFLYPLSWVLFEWLQGIVLTGLSWQQLGYTQIDLPLSGFAPLIGSHGVGLLTAMTAGGLILWLVNADCRRKIPTLLMVIWLAPDDAPMGAAAEPAELETPWLVPPEVAAGALADPEELTTIWLAPEAVVAGASAEPVEVTPTWPTPDEVAAGDRADPVELVAPRTSPMETVSRKWIF